MVSFVVLQKGILAFYIFKSLSNEVKTKNTTLRVPPLKKE